MLRKMIFCVISKIHTLQISTEKITCRLLKIKSPGNIHISVWEIVIFQHLSVRQVLNLFSERDDDFELARRPAEAMTANDDRFD